MGAALPSSTSVQGSLWSLNQWSPAREQAALDGGAGVSACLASTPCTHTHRLGEMSNPYMCLLNLREISNPYMCLLKRVYFFFKLEGDCFPFKRACIQKRDLSF